MPFQEGSPRLPSPTSSWCLVSPKGGCNRVISASSLIKPVLPIEYNFSGEHGTRTTKASLVPVLDQDGLIPQIRRLTSFLITMFRYFIRVGTSPDLRLDLFEKCFRLY